MDPGSTTTAMPLFAAAPGDEEVHGHFGLRRHCGLCNVLFTTSETIFLLLGNNGFASFSKRLGPFQFPDHGRLLPGKTGVRLCPKQDCSVCARSEASTVHSRCFDAIARGRSSKAMDYLWIMTAWRSPWRTAPYLGLEDERLTACSSMTDGLGISPMKSLPSEVHDMIYRYARDSPFWQYCMLSDVAQSLLKIPDELISIPLCDVSAWTRDSQLEMMAGECRPLLRLTIDSWGISKVESLSSTPEFTKWRTDYRVYVIADRSRTVGVIAHLKGDRLRLELPEGHCGFQIWDTPIGTTAYKFSTLISPAVDLDSPH